MKKTNKLIGLSLVAIVMLGYSMSVSADQMKGYSMYRLYNPNSGEHFYTKDVTEQKNLIKVGWKDEGIGWYAPTEGPAVYRLYNKNAGDHHYTLDIGEKNNLIKVGWKDEGIGWRSNENGGLVQLFRAYNPNAQAGSHNYTSSLEEQNNLIAHGWRWEGIAWYGIQPTSPIITIDSNKTIKVGEIYEPSKNVTAKDFLGNNLSISSNENSFDLNKEGEYTITFKATDSLGQTTTASQTITVLPKDWKKPKITGLTDMLLYSTKGTYNISEGVSVIDYKGDKIPYSVPIVEDFYTPRTFYVDFSNGDPEYYEEGTNTKRKITIINYPVEQLKEGKVPLTQEYFPDERFRTALYTNYGKYIENNIINTTGITNLDIREVSRSTWETQSIYSLKGIEYFKNLTELTTSIYTNETVDLSKNDKLEKLYIISGYAPQIKPNNNISKIYLYDFNLKNGYFSNLPNLDLFSTTNIISNQVTLENNPKLKSITIENPFNQSDKKIEKLSVNNLSNLSYLNLSNQHLNDLDVTTLSNLTNLSLHGNNLKTIDLKNNINLNKLVLSDNLLTQIDLSQNKKLTYLSIDNNLLSELNIQQNKLLQYVSYSNQGDNFKVIR